MERFLMTFDNTVPGKNNLSRLYQFFSISDGLKSPTTLGNIWCHTGRFAYVSVPCTYIHAPSKPPGAVF